jgi:heme/copper-type cytochrome/quinol oxidase subunit 2
MHETKVDYANNNTNIIFTYLIIIIPIISGIIFIGCFYCIFIFTVRKKIKERKHYYEDKVIDKIVFR